MDLFPSAFPTLSPLVVEDLKPRPTEHTEVLQDRAEAAINAKVRAARARGPPAPRAPLARQRGLCVRTRRADVPRTAPRRRAPRS